jgi:putative transposase
LEISSIRLILNASFHLPRLRLARYSPHQNGKQEAFFGPVEGRLLKMLDGVDDLDLRTLNNATQAWVELEHNTEPLRAPRSRRRGRPEVVR